MKTADERLLELAPKAFERWGISAQMVKTCEELAELTQQLCKRLNGSPTTIENIVDEIADVLVMTNQMKLYFGVDAVKDRVHYKLDRLEKVLSETPNTRL